MQRALQRTSLKLSNERECKDAMCLAALAHKLLEKVTHLAMQVAEVWIVSPRFDKPRPNRVENDVARLLPPRPGRSDGVVPRTALPSRKLMIEEPNTGLQSKFIDRIKGVCFVIGWHNKDMSMIGHEAKSREEAVVFGCGIPKKRHHRLEDFFTRK